MGRHKITVENLPDDMTWVELKDLGREYGRSLTFARTFQYRRVLCGMLEFQDRGDADVVFRELDNRRIEGAKQRLRVSHGDLSEEDRNRGRGDGQGGRHQSRDDRGGRRDFDDRRDCDRERRVDHRRDDRSPPRGCDRRRDRDDDEPIMTLFVMGLPDDAREGEIMDDLERDGATRVVMMSRNGEGNCFVRFKSLDEAERAIDQINDGRVKVCQERVRAEMARRNTTL